MTSPTGDKDKTTELRFATTDEERAAAYRLRYEL